MSAVRARYEQIILIPIIDVKPDYIRIFPRPVKFILLDALTQCTTQIPNEPEFFEDLVKYDIISQAIMNRINKDTTSHNARVAIVISRLMRSDQSKFENFIALLEKRGMYTLLENIIWER